MDTEPGAMLPASAWEGVGGSAEAPAWAAVGTGWCPLFGGLGEVGFSVEWHDFLLPDPLDWSRSFHPGSVEVCLNLTGSGQFRDGERSVAMGARQVAFYHQSAPPLSATRSSAERHQFMTVEFAPGFLADRLTLQIEHLHPLVRRAITPEPAPSAVVLVQHPRVSLVEVIEDLRRPPVPRAAQRVWFESKALELASLLFFERGEERPLCTRALRCGRERVEYAQTIIRRDLCNPPPLADLARLVGCSPYYLSRLFSQHVGQTIQQYVRDLRLERAAELLASGQCNVTEAAFAVGYNSLSHFSTAFHEMFGCCPGLYPLRRRP